jgi:acetyltransferase-like isoleucine patch superfamily enzyme
MSHQLHHKKIQNYIKLSKKFKFLFQWLRYFYPRSKGINYLYLLYFFLPQKIFRINGRVGWPVHFTSRVLYYKSIKVGNRSAPGMNANCYIQGRNGIIIGHNVRIGPGVGLISANHQIDDYDQWTHDPSIVIGNNVWIGMNAVVLPGVKIGNNVVIGTNSVVMNDIPANSIAGGNPCKALRQKKTYSGKDYSNL